MRTTISALVVMGSISLPTCDGCKKGEEERTVTQSDILGMAPNCIIDGNLADFLRAYQPIFLAHENPQDPSSPLKPVSRGRVDAVHWQAGPEQKGPTFFLRRSRQQIQGPDGIGYDFSKAPSIYQQLFLASLERARETVDPSLPQLQVDYFRPSHPKLPDADPKIPPNFTKGSPMVSWVDSNGKPINYNYPFGQQLVSGIENGAMLAFDPFGNSACIRWLDGQEWRQRCQTWSSDVIPEAGNVAAQAECYNKINAEQVRRLNRLSGPVATPANSSVTIPPLVISPPATTTPPSDGTGGSGDPNVCPALPRLSP